MWTVCAYLPRAVRHTAEVALQAMIVSRFCVLVRMLKLVKLEHA
jgi:hypothetical protein